MNRDIEEATAPDKITLRVKTMNDSSVLNIEVNKKSDSVLELKNKILQTLAAMDKSIRLISSGKLLDPSNAKLAEFNLQDGTYIHAVISSSNQIRENTCFDSSSDIEQLAEVNTSSTRQVRGLDRLLSCGMSIDEVAALRSYFRSQVDDFATTTHFGRLPGNFYNDK